MTINDEILTIANKLANEGKKPTVALVKTRLSTPAPLPQIIAILKTWQHDPDFAAAPEINLATDSKELKTPSDLSTAIAQAIAPLQQEITELKKLVQQLINKG